MKKNHIKIVVLLMGFALGLVFLSSVVDAQPRPLTPDEIDSLVGGRGDLTGASDVDHPGRDSICAPSILLDEVLIDGSRVPVCGNFLDHADAERNYYHCQEGVAIMGAAINQIDPSFVPVLSTEDFSKRAGNDCSDSFEIYPDSGICPYHDSWKEAEIGHDACTLTNFQYWDYLQYLMNMVPHEKACDDLGWGGAPNNQARWKPKSESNGNVVVLLPNEYCSDVFGASGAFGPTYLPKISNMRVEDALGGVIDRGRLRHCGEHNNGRLHWNFGSPNSFAPGPIFVRYEVDGVEECRRVGDPFDNLGR